MMLAMRRILIIALLLAAAVYAGDTPARLDMKPPVTLRAGYQISLNGSPFLRVIPSGDDRASIYSHDQYREIDLPVVTPYSPEAPDFAWPQTPETPRFAVQSWATVVDGLALLLPPALLETGRLPRFGAVLRLSTQPGRVGNCRTKIAARTHRLPDAALDALVESFFRGGPLPPLTAGEALCEVEAVLVEGRRPMLTVWIGTPRPVGENAVASINQGVLLQEPLLPPADAFAAEPAASAYNVYLRERAAEAKRLRAILAAENAPPLFGAWRRRAEQTSAAVGNALNDVTPEQSDALMLLGAWASMHERKMEPALTWIDIVAGCSPNREFAEEAALLGAAWRRRSPVLVDNPSSFPFTHQLYALEMHLALSADLPPKKRLPAALKLARAVAAHHLYRADGDLMLRAALGEAATALADICAEHQPAQLFAALPALLPASAPYADRVLYDTAIISRCEDRTVQAIELHRYLMAIAPTSPLAPASAWAMTTTLIDAGRHNEALDTAAALAHRFGPGSDWRTARGDSGEAAPWVAGFDEHVAGVDTLRARALHLLRDAYFDRYRRNAHPGDLAAAERFARMLLDTLPDNTNRRADWLALGHLLWWSGHPGEAGLAYANVSLGATDDALRLQALKGLGACMTPDAARVAAALREDAELGALLAPLLR